MDVSLTGPFYTSLKKIFQIKLYLLCFVACTNPSAVTHSIDSATKKVGDSLLIEAEALPENWMSYGQTYSEQRFSQLAQIHVDNAKDLGLAWSINLGTKRGLEATPLVVDGFMFVSGPWGWVYAIDAREGKLLWTFDPEVSGAHAQKACCDVVNRGLALYEGKVYVGTLDGRLIALRAATGEVLWEKWTVDRTQSYTSTGAPRVVDGKVLIGNSGAEFGVRGYISAYNATNGELVWRFYTVPTNPAEGFESHAMEKAAQTWTGEWWKYGGGGTVWDAIAYDPELGYLYIGTGNGSPWDRNHRSPGGGDNLYLSSIVALKASTGEYVWHYQSTPGDSWDFTATQHIILADINWKGKARKVLFQAPKNGFFYVLDRTDGTLLSAEPYVYVNWASHIDSLSGRPLENPMSRYKSQNVQVLPSPSGGHNWQPMAYNPVTGLVYLPAREEAMTFGHDPYWKYDSSGVKWNLGIRYNSRQSTWVDSTAPKVLPSEKLIAWDPYEQKPVWEVRHQGIYNGGVLATAGNLVFQGTASGKFCAYHAESGKLLWEFDLKSGIIAPPISYSIGGTQYISIAVGWGGAWGLSRKYTQFIRPGTLYTFALEGSASLPTYPEPDPPQLVNLPVEAHPGKLQHGLIQYSFHCQICHGIPGDGGGVIPDLAYSSKEAFSLFEKVVLEGILVSQGMPDFADILTQEDVDAIKNHILNESLKRRNQ